MIDYHIHTPLCNHAKGSMAAMVRSALSRGFREICFLDHLIVDGPGMKNSMSIDEVSLYMQAIGRLRRIFDGKITIRAGLEVDFIPEKIDVIRKILDRFDFDMIGASVHFVDGVNVASRRAFPGQTLTCEKKRSLVIRYFEQVYHLLDYDFFDVICHPDIVKKTGIPIDDSVEPLIDGIIDRIALKKICLEFNTGGWNHPVGDSYPSESFVRKCRKKGIVFTVGSDAHSPEKQGIYIERALYILKHSGYTYIHTYNRRTAGTFAL